MRVYTILDKRAVFRDIMNIDVAATGVAVEHEKRAFGPHAWIVTKDMLHELVKPNAYVGVFGDWSLASVDEPRSRLKWVKSLLVSNMTDIMDLSSSRETMTMEVDEVSGVVMVKGAPLVLFLEIS